MERLFDIVLSGLGLVILIPLFLPLIVILKLTGEGEVFFFQERIGKDGRNFKLIKFATMLKNSPNIGTGTVTMKGDPRILPLGNFLRKTKINELPQLFNIFLGSMSVIGPRPLTNETFAAYSVRTQNIIKQVRPGLSGVGSIIFRGEEDIMNGASASVEFYKNVIAPYKGALEEWFVSNKGSYLYLTCILLTLWTVCLPNTAAAWTVFRNLPQPPEKLKVALNYFGARSDDNTIS